jgi:hypothetical protein
MRASFELAGNSLAQFSQQDFNFNITNTLGIKDASLENYSTADNGETYLLSG